MPVVVTRLEPSVFQRHPTALTFAPAFCFRASSIPKSCTCCSLLVLQHCIFKSDCIGIYVCLVPISCHSCGFDILGDAGGSFFWRHGGTEPTDVAAGVLEHPARSVCCCGGHSSLGWCVQIINLPGECVHSHNVCTGVPRYVQVICLPGELCAQPQSLQKCF